MKIKHISRLDWGDLPKVESPLFAHAEVERDRSAMALFGIPRISGLNDALREYSYGYSPNGSQVASPEAFNWLLERVDAGEYVLVNYGRTTPMKSVLRWSMENNQDGYRVPLHIDKSIDYTQGSWRADPDLPLRLRAQVDKRLEEARHNGNDEPEYLWWGGVLEIERGGGGDTKPGSAKSPEPSRSTKPSSGADKEPEKKVDEKAKAQEMFDELANDKNIPFGYPKDCCFARAHEMCRQLEAKGVKCGKTWYYSADWPAEGSEDYPPANLFVSGLPKTDVIPDGSLKWTYHVAPTVEVDGKPMVFDPSMFKGPVTPEEWRSKMVNLAPDKGSPTIKNTDSKPFFTDPYEYTEEDPDYSKTKMRFEEHREALDEERATSKVN